MRLPTQGDMQRQPVSRPDIEVFEFESIVTSSRAMLELFELVKKVARTEASVLIRGETGTGKELVANALHKCSPRNVRSFRALNCATLTAELLASELFGHVRGAFTGAIRDRKGTFELADGGTVFLDEIAEMPLDIQARLLRVLQSKTFIPLGGTEAKTVDVRLLGATHKALREEVERQRFREDLMYRIRVVPVFLPPLCERGRDVEILAWYFIDEFNKQGYRRVDAIEPLALDAMNSYRWPGNVRELRNNVEYAFAVGEGPVLKLDELTPELRGEPPVLSRSHEFTEEELERRRLLEALRKTGGKRTEAAEELGISRSTLWRKLREHGIA